MAGLSALQFAVPAADAVLDRLRPLLTSGCTALDPAHISFGYPWLAPEVARAAIADVAAALRDVQPVTVDLTGPYRFPPDSRGRVVLWLAPAPVGGIHAIADTIASVAGLPRDFLPHCSLVRLSKDVDPAPFEALAAGALPLRTTLDTIHLHIQQSGRWHRERIVTLTERPSADPP